MLAGVLGASGAMVGLSAGGAGATLPDCAGEHVFIVPGGNVEMHDEPGFDVAIFDLGMTLEAGTYTVQTKGFDGAGRSETPELSERWMAEFLDAEDGEVGESGVTADLPDDFDYVESIDDFSGVVLSAAATRVRLVMIKDFKSPNSFRVRCLALTRLPDPTTTSTTAPATTTSTVAPTTTAAPTSTVAPTTAAPTTTAAPVVAAATLPVTGSDTMLLVIVGAAVTMVGASLMLRSRRLS